MRNATKEVELELVQCFICEKCVGRSEVREAMTMQLNDRLNQCVGDAVAQELKYHAGCLTAFIQSRKSALTT